MLLLRTGYQVTVLPGYPGGNCNVHCRPLNNVVMAANFVSFTTRIRNLVQIYNENVSTCP